MNNEQKIILHLSLMNGVGAVALNTLIQEQSARGSLDDLYHYSHQELMQYCGLNAAQASIVIQGLLDTTALERECGLLDRHAIDIITVNDACYPDLLRHIIGPPPLLYQKGKPLEKYAQRIAFVGARTATAYGKKFIDCAVPVLARYGFSIVSGGARGADSMAHEAALSFGAETIAVLGSGLLCPYPTENNKLFDRIAAQGGTVVSTFPLMAQPLPKNFPARNRIIAGLSRGCVVVQAAQKSGALITAHYALDNGRDVFAVPGALGDPLSVGCNGLITQGARLVTGPEDILLDWGIINKKPDNVSSPVAKKSVPKTIPTMPDQQIAWLCDSPCSTDELLEGTGLPSEQLNHYLFDLQIAGVIVQNAAGLWERKR